MITTASAPGRETSSGLPSGPVAWGSHLCQFYRSREDLAEILVPFFAAGLAGNERCLWVASDPLPAAAAREALRALVPDLDAREARGQIEIFDHTAWYVRAGQLGIDEVIEMWLSREREALRDGFAGLRLTGNTAWLEPHQWEAFAQYEHRVHQAFHGTRIIALCSYSLDHCGPNEIIDVLRHHGGALVRREGRWDRIESATAALAVTRDDAAIGPHSVEFYPDRFPAESVAESLRAALAASQGAGLLARRANLVDVQTRLQALGVDIAAATGRGQLLLIDANTVFEQVSTGPGIDLEVLDRTLGEPVRALVAGHGHTWLCGELVDLFCRAGDHTGALTLEEWWHTQLRTHPIELHCTYAVESFRNSGELEHFRRVCDMHSHVRGGCGDDVVDAPRLVAELQQVSEVLRTETDRRSQLESAIASARADQRNVREHLVVLQRVTQDLSKAVSNTEIHDVVVRELRAVLGASRVVISSGPGEPAPGTADMVLPLGIGGRRLGSILLHFDRPHPMGAASRALADDLAKQIAIALDRASWYERAESASRAKDEFLAMLGHELRNPLSPILTATQLMKIRAPDTMVKERSTIERQVRHMVRLVDDLLDISRVTRGKVKLELQATELSQVIGQAVELASPALEARAHQLDVSVPRTGLVVDVDPQRLAQVITNLLVNAAKYTPECGSIRLEVETTATAVLIHVVDNGNGISPALLPHVFDMFVQARQALDRTAGGLGVGLAIARTFVELHGGTISAQSAGEGCGSTFTIELPWVLAKAPPVPPAPAPQLPPQVRALRLLIVDDNADAAALFADALRMLGHEVHVAHDGPSALALAKTAMPEMCFLDVGLPVMDGYELARHLLAQQPVRPGLVAVTGYGQASDREKSKRAGFAAHLVKPVNLREVADLIAKEAASS